MKLRIILKSMFVMMLLFIITGCNEPSVVDIKLSEDNIKQNINDFNITDLNLTVTYDNNTVNIVNVTNEMISKEDLDKLNVVGKHDIKINYLDKVITLNINLTNYYEVTFILDDKVVDTQTVEHGMDAILPNESTTNKEGYTFIGWNHDGKNITEDTIIIGTYEINTYEVKFIINDLEIYEENRTFIYGETLNNDLLLYFENKYKIQIEKILIDNNIYNNEIITKNCTIQIFTEDYYSDKSNNKSDLNNVNNIEYELCVAFSNEFDSIKIIESKIINNSDVKQYIEYFKNYIFTDKDAFNVYFVINEGIDYVIIQAQYNNNKAYIFKSNLSFNFSDMLDNYKKSHNIKLSNEFINDLDGGINFKYTQNVFQFDALYENEKYELDYNDKFYKVYKDYEELRNFKYITSVSHMYRLLIHQLLYTEISGVTRLAYFDVYNHINIVGYTDISPYSSSFTFDNIRWYEFSDLEELPKKIGLRRNYIKLRKLKGNIKEFVFKDDEINVECELFFDYNGTKFSDEFVNGGRIILRFFESEINSIQNGQNIIDRIKYGTSYIKPEEIDNELYIMFLSSTVRDSVYNNLMKTELEQYYDELIDYVLKDYIKVTSNNVTKYYSCLSVNDIKELIKKEAK